MEANLCLPGLGQDHLTLALGQGVLFIGKEVLFKIIITGEGQMALVTR